MPGSPEVDRTIARNFSTMGDISSSTAKFVSTSEISENWENFIVANHHMDSFQVQLSDVAETTVKAVAKSSLKFREIFSKVPTVQNLDRMTTWERSFFIQLCAHEKLQEWLAWLLVTPDSVLTVNVIIFILEVSVSIPMGSESRPKMDAFTASLARGGTLSRGRIIKCLEAGSQV